MRSNRTINTAVESQMFELANQDDDIKTATPFKVEDVFMDFRIELLPDDPKLEQKNRLLIFSRVDWS